MKYLKNRGQRVGIISFLILWGKAIIQLIPLTLPLSPANGGEGGGEGEGPKSKFLYNKFRKTEGSTSSNRDPGQREIN
jgi:hypothetical protein